VLVQALTAARGRWISARTANSVADPINKGVSAGTFPANVSAETPTMAQQQADALALVAETALQRGIDADGVPGLDGGASVCGLGDRRLAPVGE